MDYLALARRKMLYDTLSKLSDEEKRFLLNAEMQDRNHKEVIGELSSLQKKADNNHHSFALDLGANLAGNAAWDTMLWIGSKLLKKL